MYVNPIWALLLGGRSTPATRAIISYIGRVLGRHTAIAEPRSLLIPDAVCASDSRKSRAQRLSDERSCTYRRSFLLTVALSYDHSLFTYSDRLIARVLGL